MFQLSSTFYVYTDFINAMSSEYEQITKLLTIEQKHFEDKVRRLVMIIKFH